ncbi:unnamed protein product, partial [Mesorhabditis belari]|uniref:Transmembrane and coiled-coil domains protein 1 n=1 Tax=Mesorhabditis belari TaxID=2138241 RepID=A0AAF3JBX0_9BILA
MNSSFLQNEGTEGDRSSVRSSEASGGRVSPGEEWKEKARLEEKIEAIKLKISKLNLNCEADVENFLEMSRAAEMSRGIANPQMARIKQHFEKNNKRNTQDLESLQKKLAIYEQRLRELDSGNVLETSSRSGNIVSSVERGIKKTGATMKGLTGQVISAPLDLAHIIRSSFGSADNINDETGGETSTNVGQSVFYARSENAAASTSSAQPASTAAASNKSSTLPPGLRMPTSPTHSNKPMSNYQTPETHLYSAKSARDFDALSNGSREEHLDSLLKETIAELRLTKEANSHLTKQFQELAEFVQKELKFFEKSQQEDRFRFQKLEDQLNETIDLHQAEVNVVRQELSNIANRLDYQYNDRFKKVEETMETTQNHMQRMEHTFKESLDLRLQGTAWWNAMLLGGANVLVEILKLLLFLIAIVLDFFKPFTGTRTRTGLLITIIIASIILIQNVDFLGFFIPSRRKSHQLAATKPNSEL